MNPRPFLESLEARIAPANFFLTPGTTVVKDSLGATVSEGYNVSNAGVNNTSAILLKAGDALIYDVDNNNAYNALIGDSKLAEVSAGKGLLLFGDLDGDGSIEPFGGASGVEVTGLAVTDGFKGKLYTDLNGSLTTTLGASAERGSGLDETFTPAVLLQGSILSFETVGWINGDILAGKSISNVKVGAGVSGNSPLGYSVHAILTGEKAEGVDVKYPHRDYINSIPAIATFEMDYVLPTTVSSGTAQAGGNIGSVLLARGAAEIRAGDGQAQLGTGPGGAGGSIGSIGMPSGQMQTTSEIIIEAGDGGYSYNGNGGAGGGITLLKAFLTTSSTNVPSFTLISGNGGTGIGANYSGGDAGNIERSSVLVNGNLLSFNIETGHGGDGSGKGNGGDGGSIYTADFGVAGKIGKLDMSDHVVDINGVGGRFRVHTGWGGQAFYGSGGLGGNIGSDFSPVQLKLLGADSGAAFIDMEAGHGGSSVGKGGAGGSITKTDMIFQGSIGMTGDYVGGYIGGFLVQSGYGGTAFGTSGAGAGGRLVGSIALHGSLHLIPSIYLTDSFRVAAGAGGGAILGSTGAGGTGGYLDVDFTSTGAIASEDTLLFAAGSGGTSGGAGNGGTGGAVQSSAFNFYGAVGNGVTIQAGDGGTGGPLITGKSDGGSGGALTGVTILQTGALSGSLTLAAGDGKVGMADGGNGGLVKDLSVSSYGVIGGDFVLSSGDGASSINTVKGSGGNAGAISGASASKPNIILLNSVNGGIDIQAGAGGSSRQAAGKTGGAITDLTLTVLGTVGEGPYQDDSIYIRSGQGGQNMGSIGADGGKGGAIDGLKVVTHQALDDDLIIIAWGGGSGRSAGQAGGISDLSLTTYAHVDGKVLIAASNGMFGGFQSQAGAGGNIDKVNLTDYSGSGGNFFHLWAGDGGNGYQNSTVVSAGITGGNVTNVIMDAINSRVLLQAGIGGTSYNQVKAGSGFGGFGGSVVDVTGQVKDLIVIAGNGGDNNNGADTAGAGLGFGGGGGNISEIGSSDAPLYVGETLRMVRAGDGGLASGTRGGIGGNVSKVYVQGDIGDFSSSFDLISSSAEVAHVTPSFIGQGGLVAGKGGSGIGTNGKVSDVSAMRISSIVAGIFAANERTPENAVKAISKVAAYVIGADYNNNGIYDLAADGLVVATTSGFNATTSLATVRLGQLVLV